MKYIRSLIHDLVFKIHDAQKKAQEAYNYGDRSKEYLNPHVQSISAIFGDEIIDKLTCIILELNLDSNCP